MLERGQKRKNNKVEALSNHLRNRQEGIQRILEWLATESANGTPIVVEGKKDIEALRELGVEGKIISAKTGGKSRLDLICEIEKIGVKEVILLFDFDRRGKEWTEILKQQLEKVRIKPNLTFWKKLLRFAGRDIKDIEGLTACMRTLRKKIGED